MCNARRQRVAQHDAMPRVGRTDVEQPRGRPTAHLYQRRLRRRRRRRRRLEQLDAAQVQSAERAHAVARQQFERRNKAQTRLLEQVIALNDNRRT